MEANLKVRTMTTFKNKSVFCTADAALGLFRGMIALTSQMSKSFAVSLKALNKSKAIFHLLTALPPLGGPGGATNTLDVRFPSVSSFEDVSTIEATGQGCLHLGLQHSASTHEAA